MLKPLIQKITYWNDLFDLLPTYMQFTLIFFPYLGIQSIIIFQTPFPFAAFAVHIAFLLFRIIGTHYAVRAWARAA